MAIAIPLILLFAGPAAAIDDDDPALGFLPEDSPIVLAFDIDEIVDYATDVCASWREADRAHCSGALDSISGMLITHEFIPDIWTFYGNLSGVQALSISTEGDFPLIVFSAEDNDDMDLLRRYTLSYFLEKRLKKAVYEIKSALYDYYGNSAEDYDEMHYPENLDELIEGGYLEAMPLNPYTGEPVRVLNDDDHGSPGDIFYGPGYNSYESFTLKVFKLGGSLTFSGWSTDNEFYNDLESILEWWDISDLESMGFSSEQTGGFTIYTRSDTDSVFAAGDRFLVFSTSCEDVHNAIMRYNSGTGFEFDPVDALDTDTAFYRDQANLEGIMEQMHGMMLVEAPADVSWMIDDIWEAAGITELETQYTAGWLEDGMITSARRASLNGEAVDTFMGTMLHADPEPLYTAQYGPLEIIAEVAWANVDDYMFAYIDFLLHDMAPIITEATGAPEGSVSQMLAMVGLSGIEELEKDDFADQMYIWLTSSVERDNGEFIPGLTIALKTETAEDLGYTFVGMIDTMSFMVPEFPFYQGDYDDKNATTFVTDIEELPMTPTIAWTDGWVVESLFREDALEIRDALDRGIMLMPDNLDPANMRIRCNRQELLRGIADIMYIIPEEGVPAMGAVFEVLAQLTGDDEGLMIETTGHGDFVESRAEMSTDLFENMLKVMTYVFHAFEGEM